MSESKKITRDMIFNVQYDNNNDKKTETPHADLQKWNKPCAMIVFDGGDLNNSALLVAKAAQTPFAANTIASVLVQESVRDAFISKVRAYLKPLELSVAEHAIFKRTLETITEKNTVTVTVAQYAEQSPILVCDVTQNYLSYGPSGAITLNTFRTAKEALTLLSKESLAYESVSIWNENLSTGYELATKLKSKIYYFNCHAISLEPLRTQIDSATSVNYVTIAQNHHYEILNLGTQQQVIIVFPIGTIFAN